MGTFFPTVTPHTTFLSYLRTFLSIFSWFSHINFLSIEIFLHFFMIFLIPIYSLRKFSPNFSLISSYQFLIWWNFPPTFPWFSSFQILHVGNFLPTFPWFSSYCIICESIFLVWQVVLYLLCLSVSAPRATPTLSWIQEDRVQRVLKYWQRARLSHGRTIWLLLHPLPSPVSKFSLSTSSCVSLVKFTEKKEVEGVGEEPNHTTARKPGYSFNHSILSGGMLFWSRKTAWLDYI